MVTPAFTSQRVAFVAAVLAAAPAINNNDAEVEDINIDDLLDDAEVENLNIDPINNDDAEVEDMIDDLLDICEDTAIEAADAEAAAVEHIDDAEVENLNIDDLLNEDTAFEAADAEAAAVENLEEWFRRFELF